MINKKFDMAKIRRRCRKVMKKKYNRRIKLKTVDKVWKEYVKYGIVEQMIKYGKVQVDKNFSMEIVGYKTAQDRNFKTFLRGAGIRGNMPTKSANLHKGRDGYVYHIELTDNNFREGVLIYTPTKQIRKSVHEALVNTNTYYRIAV